MQIINTTLPGHQFFPGSVSIQVTPSFGGGSEINVLGQGNGPEPLINDMIGILFFGGMTEAIAEICGAPSPIGVVP
jgi:hypothetical protein